MKSKILFSGRSMIEMLGVLAIMGIITGMSIAAYNMAMGTLNSGRTTEDITRIQQAVRSLYTEGVYADIATSTFISLGTIPTMPGDNTKARNQYGGEYIVAEGETELSFTIAVTSVPQADCVTFVTRPLPGITSISVDGSSSWKNDGSAGTTASSLIPNCDGGNKTVTFEFK
ncbi:MAG: hypothetical protein LBU68_00060 [Rickettsiales bacterium]|jgi:Tfp pilus assembly protein PilE|nr:hypothetical protein [Rickettsiales bacterium]